MSATRYAWIYTDPARGLALVRGRGIPELLDAAGVRHRATWSDSGRGFVMSAEDAAEMAAEAQRQHVIVGVREITP